MPPDQLFVCILVLATVAMFIWEKVSPDVVSMCAFFLLLVVPFNGHAILLPVDKAQKASIMAGIFGNNAILTVSFMFIVGTALERTGLAESFGRWFEKIAGRTERQAMLALAAVAIGLHFFITNTTVVLVFMPVVMGLCRRTGMAPSRFLIPLSYFAIAGGMLTMVGTSTNMIVNGIVKQKGLRPFTMFEITGLGTVLAIGTVIYLITVGRKLLPNRACLATLIDSEAEREFLTAAIVSDDSPLVGKTLSETTLAKRRDMRVIEVRRSGNRVEVPLNELRFEPGDRVIIKSRLSGVRGLKDVEGIDVAAKSEFGLTYVQTEKAVLVEGMLGPRSKLVGKTLSDIGFRQHFGVIILAVHRQGANLRDSFENLKLEVGDTLLFEGSAERMKELFRDSDVLNLSDSKQQQPTYRRKRAWVALLALAMVMILGSRDNFIPFEWVALGAALLVVLGGCLQADEVYQSIDWKIIIMILGTLALGEALDRTGASKTIVHGLMDLIGAWDKRLILSAVLLLTIIFTELLSNNAVAALLAPFAIEMGRDMGVDPRPFIVAVMIGASVGFAIPAGYQTHMMVYSAGGYRFSDFIRAGVPLDILCWILGSIFIPIFFPF
ncbi:MAG: SLC13 family permease [Verrucomicrobiota bacterium]